MFQTVFDRGKLFVPALLGANPIVFQACRTLRAAEDWSARGAWNDDCRKSGAPAARILRSHRPARMDRENLPGGCGFLIIKAGLDCEASKLFVGCMAEDLLCSLNSLRTALSSPTNVHIGRK